MGRCNYLFLSFVSLVVIALLPATVLAEDIVEKLKVDFANHPALQAENFNIEIKDFKQGFLSLYMPAESIDGEMSHGKKKDLMKKAEGLALKYPEVRDVTWFKKGEVGNNDSLYDGRRHYFRGWTANFNFGAGKLSWVGDTSWDGASSDDVWFTSFDFGKRSWPVLLHFSSNGTTTRHALTGGTGDRYLISENSYGVKRYFSVLGLSPYLGAGGTHITVIADKFNSIQNSGNNNTMMNDVTSADGYYLNLGIMKKVGKYFEVGLDAKAVRSEKATIELIENDMSFDSATFFIGFGF